MRPGTSEVERPSLTMRCSSAVRTHSRTSGVADGLDQGVTDAHGAAEGGVRNQPLHALIAPLDASGCIDRDDGVLHAVDHRFELAAALGGAVQSALDMVGGNGDGTRQAVEVAVGGVDDADMALGNRRGRGLADA